MNKKDLIKDPSFKNTTDELKDLLAGDKSILERPEFKNLDLQKLQIALDFITNNPNLNEGQRRDLVENSWKINYRSKPPTPEEFLTEKYLGPTAVHTYDRIKKVFCEFLDPQQPCRDLILYPHIGFGKSYLATLITLYLTTCVTMMRDPYKFFGLNPATNLVQLLISYSLKKSSELLLEPYLQILAASPFFEKVHTKEGMVKAQAEFAENEEVTKIYYTTASPTSALEFSGNLKIKLASSVQGLLGLSVISAVLSELAFFIDAGKSSEYIMRMYNDTKSRIESRMHGNYFGRSILDSSPNTLDSAIDDFIVNEAHKDPKNYIVEGSMWKWEPEDYDMTHTFNVFIGGRGNPPRILGANDPLLTDESSDRSKIIQVPESQRSFFEADLIKSLKDRAGIPSGSADNLIYDYNLIENIFDNKLVNIYTHIYAPADEMPSGLIWNQVYSNFFNKKAGRFEYYYKPHIPRCVSVDQSIKTDLTSISMSHVERLGDTGELCYVTDFTIVIAPKKGGKINLDAIRSFIIDLRDKGNLYIDHVSFDQFQSEAAVQGLQRAGFNVEILSVDRTLGPYENLISMISTGRYFCGKNIHLKNNLKGLHLVRPKVKNGKPKIDHDATREPIIEADDTRWETSYVGSFSKDCADSVCASVELCHKYYEHSEDTWNPRALAQMFSKKKVAQDKDSVLKIIKGKGWLL